MTTTLLNVDAAPVMAGRSTVYSLFAAQARLRPCDLAVEAHGQRWTYAELSVLVERLAGALRARAIERGTRVAILSENRVEYPLLQLACARIGAIVACLNWRLAPEEVEYCTALAEPLLLFRSARYATLDERLRPLVREILSVDTCLDWASSQEPDDQEPLADPEAGLLLLNTSGTTGRPKAALVSHRAEIARMTVLRMDLHITPEDAYLAWSPMFHMGGSEHTLASLMFGAPVVITDGLALDQMAGIVKQRRLGWLLLVPATIEPFLDALERTPGSVVGVKVVGCMADLVPADLIARITIALDAPFLNSFGATETGLPPATGHLIPVGEVPSDLAKRPSSLCEFRIVDLDGCDVATGDVGEGIVRGPTLFSGYWNDPEANRRDFRGGWFHMGDLFRRTPSGGFEFVGRSKYMIKSGGENIYPAEIERVLLDDPRIADAAVVRKADRTWGEIPVAFVAASATGDLTAEEVEAICRRRLASYKRPREIYFVRMEEFPRSATGKIMREELERRLESSRVE